MLLTSLGQNDIEAMKMEMRSFQSMNRRIERERGRDRERER